MRSAHQDKTDCDYIRHPEGIYRELSDLVAGYYRKPHYFIASAIIFSTSYAGTSLAFDKLSELYQAHEPWILSAVEGLLGLVSLK